MSEKGNGIDRRGFLGLLVAAGVSAVADKAFSKPGRQALEDLDGNQPEKEVKINPTLQMVFEAEKPTEYQKKQILNLQKELVAKAQGRIFTSTAELLSFINSEISPIFSAEEQEPTIYLKDAFGEKEGDKARGSFDCDSRSILCASVLGDLGHGSADVGLASMQGHMVLLNKKEGTIFETTENNSRSFRPIDEVQIDQLDSINKLRSHLLTLEGTDLALRSGATNVMARSDEVLSKESLAKLKEAVSLDSENLNAAFNYITLLKNKDDHQEEVKDIFKNILELLMSRYNKIEKRPVIRDEAASAELAEARDYIQDKIFDYALFVDYDMRDYQEAIKIWQKLLSLADGQEGEELNTFSYQYAIAQDLFKLQNYQEFIQEAENALKRTDVFLHPFRANKKDHNSEFALMHLKSNTGSLRAELTAAKMIVGDIGVDEGNKEEFYQEYRDDPLLRPILVDNEEMWNINFYEAAEALKKWSGYPDLLKLFGVKGELGELMPTRGLDDPAIPRRYKNIKLK